jgi:hypothetical protein
MKKYLTALVLAMAVLIMTGNGAASPGFYIGVEGGTSAPRFTVKGLTDFDFKGENSFIYGAKAGFKFLFLAVEGNVLTGSHNVTSDTSFPWDGTSVRVTYWGINGKLFLPIPLVQPYVMGGYGTYSVNIDSIGKDSNRGFNLGIGVEVKLGKIGLFAEGRYHKVKVDIEGELDMSNYTLTFGALYDF